MVGRDSWTVRRLTLRASRFRLVEWEGRVTAIPSPAPEHACAPGVQAALAQTSRRLPADRRHGVLWNLETSTCPEIHPCVLLGLAASSSSEHDPPAGKCILLCGRIEKPLYVRLAEYYERFLARTDVRMFGGALEFHIGQLKPMDKCQTDVWRLLQPRFTRTSNRAWELPGNASGNCRRVAKDLLPVVLVTPSQNAPGVASP